MQQSLYQIAIARHASHSVIDRTINVILKSGLQQYLLVFEMNNDRGGRNAGLLGDTTHGEFGMGTFLKQFAGQRR